MSVTPEQKFFYFGTLLLVHSEVPQKYLVMYSEAPDNDVLLQTLVDCIWCILRYVPVNVTFHFRKLWILDFLRLFLIHSEAPLVKLEGTRICEGERGREH